MSDLVLKIENLTKTYKLGKRGVQPLTDLNLEVKKGEFTAIMGPSGSGKTTLLNVIGCIDKASSGKVLIDNVDVAKLPESKLYKIRRDKIGFIFQNFNLVPYLNARENVELAMELAGKFKEKEEKEQKNSCHRWLIRARATSTPTPKSRRTAACRYSPRLSQRPSHNFS